MPSETTPVESIFLVTIICEAVLQDRVADLLKRLGATGYTISQARGVGRHGRRMGDIAGYNTNIELKTLVSGEISDSLMTELKAYQATHALIAFRQEVEALTDS